MGEAAINAIYNETGEDPGFAAGGKKRKAEDGGASVMKKPAGALKLWKGAKKSRGKGRRARQQQEGEVEEATEGGGEAAGEDGDDAAPAAEASENVFGDIGRWTAALTK